MTMDAHLAQLNQRGFRFEIPRIRRSFYQTTETRFFPAHCESDRETSRLPRSGMGRAKLVEMEDHLVDPTNSGFQTSGSSAAREA